MLPPLLFTFIEITDNGLHDISPFLFYTSVGFYLFKWTQANLYLWLWRVFVSPSRAHSTVSLKDAAGCSVEINHLFQIGADLSLSLCCQRWCEAALSCFILPLASKFTGVLQRVYCSVWSPSFGCVLLTKEYLWGILMHCAWAQVLVRLLWREFSVYIITAKKKRWPALQSFHKDF